MRVSIIACVLLFTTTFCICDETPKSEELSYAIKTPKIDGTYHYHNLTMNSKENGSLGKGPNCKEHSCKENQDCCEDYGTVAYCCFEGYVCAGKKPNSREYYCKDGAMSIATNPAMMFLSWLIFLGCLNASC